MNNEVRYLFLLLIQFFDFSIYIWIFRECLYEFENNKFENSTL